ncbi:hypothetical protein MLD38_028204 [Melastoma candidum]|uniref:Uncharacterized protein n=1 Tax=Melastoma candidum TaxID=119954 RepID=A0ACB9N2N7_9MYRT|nr:hypothetical protein MLD38_028204 [Melastoma candidum]
MELGGGPFTKPLLLLLSSFLSSIPFFLLFSPVSCDLLGFLSIACGATSVYVDSSNNVTWVPDADYVTKGVTGNVNYVLGTSSGSSSSLRFFPDSSASRRNCYKLPVKNLSSLVLIRGRFVYKNYDGKGSPPRFSVSVETAVVGTVDLGRDDPWTEEFVWPRQNGDKDEVSFCLIPIDGGGIPVISSVEVRPLPSGAYRNGSGDGLENTLRKRYRIDCGNTNVTTRYPFDPYDRVWDTDQGFSPSHVSTEFSTKQEFDPSGLAENPPAAVIQTARVLVRRDAMSYVLPLDRPGNYFALLYFAGILPVSPSFDILVNGEIERSNYTVNNDKASILYITRKDVDSLNITLRSRSFSPQVNGIEVYEVIEIPLETSSTTVAALQVIEQFTGLDLGWEDDPCSPTPWDHISCEGSLVTSLELHDVNLRSISPTFGDLLDLKSLDLHNTSLSGEIQSLGSLQNLESLNLSFNKLTSFGADWENLISLKVLDLKNNSLEGDVPDALGGLKDLRLLDLEDNQLDSILPDSLNRRNLEIRTSGNLCLSFTANNCDGTPSSPSIEAPQVTVVPLQTHSRHGYLAVILGAVGGALLAVSCILLFTFWYARRAAPERTCGEKAAIEIRNWNASKVFSYKEIKKATNNFKEAIGRGSFGAVYRGKLSDGKHVAVKVRSDKSQLGSDSFINEVHLLSLVRHPNLVCLEGFCYESQRQILVYEYLPGGSLSSHLHGSCLRNRRAPLSWVRRLKIALDAARGLDYLHNGMVRADATHVTTIVKGTAGYLDPEYYSTQQLTEKSDVYSFGVVLLELICGREPLNHSGTPDSFNLVLWAKPYLQAGSFDVVDEYLRGGFDIESMRKAAAVAITSVERDASKRPTIAKVLAELKEAYSIHLSHLASSGHMN